VWGATLGKLHAAPQLYRGVGNGSPPIVAAPSGARVRTYLPLTLRRQGAIGRRLSGPLTSRLPPPASSDQSETASPASRSRWR
jgi:hypothetical protein